MIIRQILEKFIMGLSVDISVFFFPRREKATHFAFPRTGNKRGLPASLRFSESQEDLAARVFVKLYRFLLAQVVNLSLWSKYLLTSTYSKLILLLDRQ